MKPNGFTLCAYRYIEDLESENRYSTAHVYRNALSSFSEFLKTRHISFRDITRDTLKHYNRYLLIRNKKLNTISTYMRMLRCIYNRGVDRGEAPYVHRLFHDVFTGVDTRHKKALPTNELHALLHTDPGSDKLRRTQAIANLLFQFCGMPFVDLAHLKRRNLEQGILKYYRQKTGASMSVEILESAKQIMPLLLSTDIGTTSHSSDYLFSILSSRYSKGESGGYIEYQSALRRFNNQLKNLARICRIRTPVTSYTLRHSWATTAKYRGVPVEMISESLGHKSIKTTQIYLKSFEISERTMVNKLNYAYVKNCRIGGCV